MLCLICRQADLVAGIVSVDFERDEVTITVNNVPARVCPKCGDAVVDEDVASQLLSAIDEVLESGMIESTQDFQEF